MKLIDALHLRRLMLMLLLALLAGCAHNSSAPCPPAPQPAVPPLPAQAKQQSWPTFSASVAKLFEEWQRKLTTPSTEGEPAKPPTNP